MGGNEPDRGSLNRHGVPGAIGGAPAEYNLDVIQQGYALNLGMTVLGPCGIGRVMVEINAADATNQEDAATVTTGSWRENYSGEGRGVRLEAPG